MKQIHALVLVFAACGGSVVALPETGCKTTPPVNVPDVVEAGTQVSNDICSLIEGIDDNGTIRTICATVQEIADIIAFVTTLRQADAGLTARIVRNACDPLPGTTFCATSAERSKGIAFVLQRRAALLMLDAGAAK